MLNYNYWLENKCTKKLFTLNKKIYIYQIFQELTSECDIKKIVWPSLFLAVIYIYIFVANIMAQEITDHNNDVFITA